MKHHRISGSGRGRAISAFTLMEVLVVISLIVLLLAMIQPSLHTARQNAKAVKCLTIIRQLGVALGNYSDDNQGYMAPYKTPFQPTPKAYWGGLLAQSNYVPPGEPFDCPGYDPPRTLVYQAKRTDPEKNWFYTEYGMNWQNVGSLYRAAGAGSAGIGTPPAPCPTLRASSIANQEQTIYLVDSWGKIWEGTANESGIAFVGDSFGASSTGSAHARHLKSVNVVFVDTHAERIPCSNPNNPYLPDALTDYELQPDNNLWDVK